MPIVDLYFVFSRFISCSNTVVSNHVNSDHVPSFSCLNI